ncbi:uncharacterized protein [Branchiostoma lanceolatum]
MIRHCYKVAGRSCIEQIISGFRTVTTFNLQSHHTPLPRFQAETYLSRSVRYKMSGRLSLVLCVLAMVCVVSSRSVINTQFACLMECLACSQRFHTSVWNGLACKHACNDVGPNSPYDLIGAGIDAFCSNFIET